jgi:hypothetical protein
MRLAKRKTRLIFITNQTARYRGKEREIVVEVYPEYASVRLHGTRTRYEVSWRGVFELAAEIYVRRAQLLKTEREMRRKELR